VRARLAAGERLEDLPAALDWQPGWDWALYEELVEYALGQPWPLMAANLDRQEIHEIYRNPPALAGGRSTAAPLQQALEGQMRVSHGNMLPESQVPSIRRVRPAGDRPVAGRLGRARGP